MTPNDSQPNQPDWTDDAIVEPPNSTVSDWHGQVEQRQEQLADEALVEAGGDEEHAEELFDRRGGNDPENLPRD